MRRALILVIAALAACDRDSPRNDAAQTQSAAAGALTTAADSGAEEREAAASLAGGAAPGAKSYSYRGVYAGMTRAQFEARVQAVDVLCTPAQKGTGLTCAYDVTMAPDSAHVTFSVSYEGADSASLAPAHVITATRELPIDVDGVRLARMLADAFEKQTSLLDKRDATYGHHLAQIRIGTIKGAEQNFADVSITPKGGRELLTVTLTRSRH